MKIEIVGLLALGVLNILTGSLLAFLSFRLSEANKLIVEVEKRISRLEILTSLSDSSTVGSAKGKARGTS